MKHIPQLLALAGAAALCLSGTQALAQGGPGGDRDPAQWQQRMLERTRESLQITDNTEWAAVEPLVRRVSELRREQLGAGMRGLGRRGGDGGGGAGAGRVGGEPAAEETALRTAIEANAAAGELRTRMDAFRRARAAKETELRTAQDNLKRVLNARQEAIALQMGLVN